MDKVRIGFVGVGGMGQMAHLRNYAFRDDCEVVALAEIRPETAKLVAARYGIGKVYASHREMLASERLDGVVASQQFARHATLLPEIYPNVKNVFTEKPLAVSVEAGEKLAAAAKAAGCTHMVGYHKRSDPATIYTKRTIDAWKASGEMGQLRYVRLSMPAGDWRAGGFVGLLNAGDQAVDDSLGQEGPIAGMDEKVAERYVSFVNYYIHQVNLMRHLMGESFRVTYAEDSEVLLAVRSDSGVTGVIEMTPYRTTLAWEESALVAFEKGYLLLRLPAPLAVNRPGEVEIYADSGSGTPMRTSPTLPWVHAMGQQATNFVEVCRGAAAPPCVAAEAVEDLKIARDYIHMRHGTRK